MIAFHAVTLWRCQACDFISTAPFPREGHTFQKGHTGEPAQYVPASSLTELQRRIEEAAADFLEARDAARHQRNLARAVDDTEGAAIHGEAASAYGECANRLDSLLQRSGGEG